jgi:hypothetical protein
LCCRQALPRDTIFMQNITLDQLGHLLILQPAEVALHHAADSSVDAFRRKAVGHEKAGHISPLATYDCETHRFLIRRGLAYYK